MADSGNQGGTKKDKDAAILDCALGNRPSTGTNGGRWAAGCFNNVAGIGWFLSRAAEAEREPRVLGGPGAPLARWLARPESRVELWIANRQDSESSHSPMSMR
jgi:hypothetical protein